MEGRKPPPKASHPFPNNPNLMETWNKPYLKALAKTMFTVCGIYFALAGLNMYLTRHQKGFFGMDMTINRGDMKRKFEAMTNFTELRPHVPSLVPEFESKATASKVRMSFSDRVELIPPPQA